MTYQCSEFLDDVLGGLEISVETENVSLLGDLALDEIERLQGIESAARALLNDFTDGDLVANLRDALARPKMEPLETGDEDNDEEDGPDIGDRDICTNCGLEVEWTGEEWRDRGNNPTCGIAFQKPGPIAAHTVGEEDEEITGMMEG